MGMYDEEEKINYRGEFPEARISCKNCERLERICKELAGVRAAADKHMSADWDFKEGSSRHWHDELANRLQRLSPEARDYK